MGSAPYRSSMLALLAWLVLPACVLATDLPVVEYDHFVVNEDAMRTVKVAPEQPFQVVIQNTCPERFDISYAGVERPDVSAHKAAACEAENEVVTIIHDERYGGYLVKIESESGPVSVSHGGDKKELRSVTLAINVAERGWRLEFAGAFTGSDLRDERFALRSAEIDGAMQQFLVRDRRAEDSERLGIANFVHVSHTRWVPVALSFGAGFGEGSSEVGYFLGLSARLGGEVFLTAGWNWGTVDRAPLGEDFVDVAAFDPQSPPRPVSDTNVLNNLSEPTDDGVFFAVSYGFTGFGARDGLKKPFKPAK